MARFFQDAGVKAVAVHSGPDSAPRTASLDRLRQGDLRVIFTVDMFNEGVDLPATDTVLLLRPTESRIVWLQQVGRGLRKAENKPHLTVIDYIGNHRSFLLKPQTLFQLPPGDDQIARAFNLLAEGQLELPPGCEVTYELEAVDILRALLRLPRKTDALKQWYEQFRDLHGTRPTALEAFHEGYNPRAARRQHGSWLRFVAAQGDLGLAEAAAMSTAGPFLDELGVTKMERSYEMVLLLAMLGEGAFPGELAIGPLAEAFARVAARSATLRQDVSVSLDDAAAVRRLVRENPVDAWVKGGAFAYQEGVFRSVIEVPAEQRTAVQELTRELVEWRLAEYLGEAKHDADNQTLLKVIHAGGRPILHLDRTKQSLPTGWTPIVIDGEAYEANFMKVAVNVVRRPGSEQNELPRVLRRWYGPDAGLAGTRHTVALETADAGYQLTPSGTTRKAELQRWQTYAREEIPALFGLEFTPAIWNAGFVRTAGHLFLLVTLDKGGKVEAHQYHDRFLAPDLLEWQSQNRTTRASELGQDLAHHAERQIPVHLFARTASKADGRAAPFVYCGDVTFVDWNGDQPITVRWQLPEAVPERLRALLEPQA
jgi:hypothetical protein